jgi:dTDP-4-dehydrorhamnose reductase
VIVNCAAYTKVDQAEREEPLAMLINGLAVQNLCLACQEADIPLVHFSTDYVFDGNKAGPYTIYDHPNPINAYGRTKLLGEKYVLWLLNRFYLVRTSWLFGINGPNFIETMLNLAQKHKQVSVVNDQKGCPTWTQHLSEAAVSLIESGRYGVYHATNSGPTTWFEYAREIFHLAETGTEVLPITSEQFPTAATRPRNSVLDPFPLPEVMGREMPTWQEALRQYLEQRKANPKP